MIAAKKIRANRRTPKVERYFGIRVHQDGLRLWSAKHDGLKVHRYGATRHRALDRCADAVLDVLCAAR